MERSRIRRRKWAGAIAFAPASALALNAGTARADPLRLRADAVAETQSPAGLVVLQGSDKMRPGIDAEALVWAGARTSATATADVLVLSMRLREPHGYGEVRAGRFVFATGAIRPLQIDGASALARAPWESTVETMAGIPVAPRFGPRSYDWVAAGRIAQSVASHATLGVSYVQRREHGEIADDEVGADLAAVPTHWLDLAARSAYDLTSPGITDALVSAAGRAGEWRVEGFATHRSPSRLLPATSLFSVLGDVPSDMVGTTLRWNAAPRLDLRATGAAQRIGDEYGENASVGALLRLDDKGTGNVGVEMRRQSVSTARWSGLRVVDVLPLGAQFRFSSELEIAVPDDPRGRGVVWPWGLVALSWRSHDGWEAASGMEAAATPEHRFELNALVRLSRVLAIQ